MSPPNEGLVGSARLLPTAPRRGEPWTSVDDESLSWAAFEDITFTNLLVLFNIQLDGVLVPAWHAGGGGARPSEAAAFASVRAAVAAAPGGCQVHGAVLPVGRAFLRLTPGSQLSPLHLAPLEAILLICAAAYALVHPMLSWGQTHVGLNFDQIGAKAGINPRAPGGIVANVHARLDAVGRDLDLVDIMVHDFCNHFGSYMSDSLDYILRAPWLHAFLMDDRCLPGAALLIC
ncbi:hypothetical protein T492DRAFT_877762 [Pavlovales sp. CCMP2436]|nr:hypothetical protein T492DRAFT_877762 [Pavlovales sp. CCMP2436]